MCLFMLNKLKHVAFAHVEQVECVSIAPFFERLNQCVPSKVEGKKEKKSS